MLGRKSKVINNIEQRIFVWFHSVDFLIRKNQTSSLNSAYFPGTVWARSALIVFICA